jgi:hypothetical protein
MVMPMPTYMGPWTNTTIAMANILQKLVLIASMVIWTTMMIPKCLLCH